jgi:16S rRNA (guanine527-N7)-methyltransferase
VSQHGTAISTISVTEQVFADRLQLATRYVEMLREHGVTRGLIGPREVDRLWERHVLNSAVVGERIPKGARVVDVGSGAGLPGIPLALARPDLDIVLVEPMARRVDWLTEVIATLGHPFTVVRGRAEDPAVRGQVGNADVVTARAVAPLARLAEWCLPLVRPHGVLLALKGASAVEEVARDRDAVLHAGGGPPEVTVCGAGRLAMPTTVVVVERLDTPWPRKTRSRRST